MKSDVVDGDRGLVEVAHDLDEVPGTALRGDREPSRVIIDDDLALGVADEDLAGPGDLVGPMDDDLDAFTPTWALSSSAVPQAMTRPWSTTAIVSASSSASSRYWVVSSSVVPRRTRERMTSHMPSRP